jgi:enamine deaminase RidA (YjgF/YER057c/UK114 family)
VHDFVISDDLDTNFLTTSGHISSSDHVGEDALAGVTEHVVAAVQHLTGLNPVVPEDKS